MPGGAPASLSDDQLRAALGGLREGVQVLAPDWRYLYLNEAAAGHGRKTVDELLGRTMLECYPGIEKTELFAALERCMRERVTATMENEFVHAGGERSWFELRIEPTPAGLLVLSVDVTDRKRIEGALRQGEKLHAVGQLAASIAHDLKNVFNPIGLQARVLRASVPAGATQAIDALDRIDEAVRSGSETVERLRGFSKKEPEAPPGVIELEPAVDTAIALCSLRLRERPGITLRREGGAAPAARVRSGELATAIVNLVVNAIDALGERGTVIVRTGALDGLGFVEVADDGPGFTAEAQRRAFEPFFTTKPQGTGLGLAGAYGFVGRHGGKISLDTGPGRGTRLRLMFPAAQAAAAAAAAAAAPVAPRPAPGPRKLLLAEDEPASRAALKTLLVEEGFQVEAAADGDEALERLRAAPVDVLLLDWHLPGTNGLSLAAQARALEATLPVVVMSGADPSDPSEAGLAALTRAPATAYVGKPIDFGQLLQAIDRVTARRTP